MGSLKMEDIFLIEPIYIFHISMSESANLIPFICKWFRYSLRSTTLWNWEI